MLFLHWSLLILSLSLWSSTKGASPVNPRDDVTEEKFRGQRELAARQKRSDDVSSWEPVTSAQAQRIASLEAQLTALESARGATYIRWGSAKYNELGGGANRLCLTNTPAFDETTPLNGYFSLIHGTEWYVSGHDHTEVPCAVCRVPAVTSVLMVPGTNACPPGWAPQYSGHITASSNQHVTAAEFLCADGNPENREGNAVDNEGGFFMYSVTACGALPCPPYVNGKVVTCVVCAK